MFLIFLQLESTQICVVYCQNQEYGCSWRGQYGHARNHLEEHCEARKVEVLVDLLTKAEAEKVALEDKAAALEAEVDEHRNQAEKAVREKIAEKLFLEAEVDELKKKVGLQAEGAVRAKKESDQHVSVLTNRLRIVEEHLIQDRQMLAEERAEQEKKVKALEDELTDKRRALQMLVAFAEEKNTEMRHQETAPTKGKGKQRDSRTPRRHRRRSSRSRRRGELTQRDQLTTCAPPHFAPADYLPGFAPPAFPGARFMGMPPRLWAPEQL